MMTMKNVVALVTVAPMRKDPSHKSEMVNQLLFGELAKVLDASGDFTLIKLSYDNYEGWVQTCQLLEVDEHFAETKLLGYSYRKETTILLNHTKVPVSVATPVYSNANFGKYQVDYIAEHVLEFDPLTFDGYIIKSIALLYLNTPYLWGGKSSFGIDCSGFTQQVFKLFDKKIPRDSSEQAKEGEEVGKLEDAQCGDLAFFDNDEGKIIHVGLLLSNHEIIHASGYVRIDQIDSKGIIHSETNQHTHKLKVIRRI